MINQDRDEKLQFTLGRVNRDLNPEWNRYKPSNQSLSSESSQNGYYPKFEGTRTIDPLQMKIKRKEAKQFYDTLKDVKNLEDIEEIMLKKISEKNCYDRRNDLDETFSMFQHYVSDEGLVFKDTFFPDKKSSLVNNYRMCKNAWKDSLWERLFDIYPNARFCKIFDPKVLFKYGGPQENQIAVLTALCHFPKLIEDIFINPVCTPSGAYMCQIQLRGLYKQILVDDMVPVDSNGEAMFLPPNVSDPQSTKVDFWPQIIAKAYAKDMINYERLCKQTVPNFLRDQVGRPSRNYKMKQVNWSMIRHSFERNYLCIMKASDKFKSKYCLAKQVDACFVYLNHAYEVNPNLKQIELRCYSHIINKVENFNLMTMMKLNEDWKQQRNYTKLEEPMFWLTWDEFIEYFTDVNITVIEEHMDRIAQKFTLKDNHYSMNIDIVQNGPCVIEIQQMDKLFCDPNYQYANIRMFLVKKSDKAPKNLLYKAIYEKNSREVYLETMLEKGSYLLICEIDKISEARDFMLNIWYSQVMEMEAEQDNEFSCHRHYKDVLCNVAIDKGVQEKLMTEGEVSRYTMNSEKLGLKIFAFTNSTENKYSLIEKFQTKGDFVCSVEMKQNYLHLNLPPYSKKAIIFKYSSAKETSIEIADHCMQITG